MTAKAGAGPFPMPEILSDAVDAYVDPAHERPPAIPASAAARRCAVRQLMAGDPCARLVPKKRRWRRPTSTCGSDSDLDATAVYSADYVNQIFDHARDAIDPDSRVRL